VVDHRGKIHVLGSREFQERMRIAEEAHPRYDAESGLRPLKISTTGRRFRVILLRVKPLPQINPSQFEKLGRRSLGYLTSKKKPMTTQLTQPAFKEGFL